ncbi:MAG: ABC transporter substrate-binding protein [Pseudomonadota bacterium]
MHRSYDGSNDPPRALPVTTGPFQLIEWETGVCASVRRREDAWWGGEVWLDGVEWVDHGTDPTTMIAALESEEVDASHETKPNSLQVMGSVGIPSSGIDTGATIVIRTNVNEPPYDDARAHQSMQLALDNEVLLQLGINGAGSEAANHHVGPMHIDCADFGPQRRDPAKAMALLEEAGHTEAEFDVLVDEALGTPDVEARRTVMAKIEDNLRDACIIIQPLWPNLYRSHREGVMGYGAHQASEQHLDKAWLES